jgi:hypothetical protein
MSVDPKTLAAEKTLVIGKQQYVCREVSTKANDWCDDWPYNVEVGQCACTDVNYRRQFSGAQPTGGQRL